MGVRKVRGDCARKIASCSGQATVEAAFMTPLFLVGLLLLIQPGIILYDRMVMQQAASEGCRVLATCPVGTEEQCRAYVLRRLESVPSQSLFHIHEGGCTWKVDLTGDETSRQTTVAIENKVKPLPLMGLGAGLLGLLDEDGTFCIRVEESLEVQPAWVDNANYADGPAQWIGSWNHD